MYFLRSDLRGRKKLYLSTIPVLKFKRGLRSERERNEIRNEIFPVSVNAFSLETFRLTEGAKKRRKLEGRKVVTRNVLPSCDNLSRFIFASAATQGLPYLRPYGSAFALFTMQHSITDQTSNLMMLHPHLAEFARYSSITD